MAAMRNPNAMLLNLDESAAQHYQDTLFQAKAEKVANSRKRVRDVHLNQSHNVKVAIFLIRWSCHCKSPKLCVRCRSGRTWKQNGTSMRSCSPRLRFRAMSTKLTVSSVRIWIYSLIIRLNISNPSCHPSLLLQCLIPWLQWIKHYTVAMRTSSTRCFRRQCWVCSPSSQRTKDGTSNSWRQTEKLRSR